MRRCAVPGFVSLLMAVSLVTVGSTARAMASASQKRDAVSYLETMSRQNNAGSGSLPSKLKRLWTKHLVGRVSYPIVAGGRIFVTANGNGHSYATLYAFHGTTGKKLWGTVTAFLVVSCSPHWCTTRGACSC